MFFLLVAQLIYSSSLFMFQKLNCKKLQQLMQEEQFTDKAQRLLQRLSTITLKQTNMDNLNSTGDQFNRHNLSQSNLKTPESYTLLQLNKLEQQLSQNQEQNNHKVRNLNQEIRKLENYIRQETESRLKVNQHFIANVNRVQKNLENSLATARKIHADREKRLEDKIQTIIRNQHKLLNQQVDEHDKIELEIRELHDSARKLGEEIVREKRNGAELQEKIFKQFNDQIKELKIIFQKTIKQREEREVKILEMLKNTYKKHSLTLKEEEVARQSSQKMFLTVIEQLIDRITEA